MKGASEAAVATLRLHSRSRKAAPKVSDEVHCICLRGAAPCSVPRESRAWTGLRCCRLKLRERVLRWRRRQAQMWW